jgi:hypothetical protein
VAHKKDLTVATTLDPALDALPGQHTSSSRVRNNSITTSQRRRLVSQRRRLVQYKTVLNRGGELS